MSELAINGGHLVLKDSHLLKGACTCCGKWCCYTWESVWNSTTNVWSTPAVVKTECKLRPFIIFTWLHTADPCVAQWVDVTANCTDDSTCSGDVGGANAPTGVPGWTPVGCTNPCGLSCDGLPSSFALTYTETPHSIICTPPYDVPGTPIYHTTTLNRVSGCTYASTDGYTVKLNGDCRWILSNYPSAADFAFKSASVSPVGSYTGSWQYGTTFPCPTDPSHSVGERTIFDTFAIS